MECVNNFPTIRSKAMGTMISIVTFFVAGTCQASWIVEKVVTGQDEPAQILSVYSSTEDLSANQPRLLRSIPRFLFEEKTAEGGQYEEWAYPQLPEEYKNFIQEDLAPFEKAEVKVLVDQGPPANRIDLTILGDGYTEAEKDRFFNDAQRITDDLFGVNTFSSYLPLFNVYAVFVASRDSGITDGSKRKQTAFGLYRRPAGSKRGIMPGNTTAIRRALNMAPARADYPIIIANDDYYGGLGGQYAITTRSKTSGSMVLRHELGHNFGDVGEEYDGGYVYSGANFSSISMGSKNIKWAHWLAKDARLFDAKHLKGAYVWYNLGRGPYSTTFDFPNPNAAGDYLFGGKVSTVGWATDGDVQVSLDGTPIRINGVYTQDRSFFDLVADRSLAPGRHTLTVTEKIKDGDNVLAYARLYAYEAKYDFSNSELAGHPVYDVNERFLGYRSTHDQCLMRNMRSPHFCANDQENIWIKFLGRIGLIDSVDVKPVDTAKVEVILNAPKLKKDELMVSWFEIDRSTGAERELTGYKNMRQWTGDRSAGRYRVKLKFRTPEVRKYNSRFEASEDFEI